MEDTLEGTQSPPREPKIPPEMKPEQQNKIKYLTDQWKKVEQQREVGLGAGGKLYEEWLDERRIKLLSRTESMRKRGISEDVLQSMQDNELAERNDYQQRVRNALGSLNASIVSIESQLKQLSPQYTQELFAFYRGGSPIPAPSAEPIPQGQHLVNRRGFLKLGLGAAAAATLAAAGVGLHNQLEQGKGAATPLPLQEGTTPAASTPPPQSPETSPSSPSPAPEAPPQNYCRGVFMDGHQDFYFPGTDTVPFLPPTKTPHAFRIEGYSKINPGLANPYRYLARDTQTNTLYEVPIKELKVTGDPIPENKITPDPFLGIRVDDPTLIPEAKKMGVSKVRIELGGGDNISKETLDAIKAAKEDNLEIILAFHPTEPQPESELIKRLSAVFNDNVLGDYQNIAVELGNEADNLHPDPANPTLKPYWEGGNLNTFADFIKLSSEAIRQIPGRENTRLIIGALIVKEHYTALLNNLINKGVDLNQFTIAIHAYDHAWDVQQRTQYVKNLIASLNSKRVQESLSAIKSPLWITELGVNSPDKTPVIEMLDEARKDGIEAVLVHQLAPYQNFGFLDQPSFNLMQCYSQNSL